MQMQADTSNEGNNCRSEAVLGGGARVSVPEEPHLFSFLLIIFFSIFFLKKEDSFLVRHPGRKVF